MESGKNSVQQMAGNKQDKGHENELPTETSPYVNYTDIEDYKRKGYGTDGHQEPVERHAAGSTDAPTLSGADVPPSKTAPAFANTQS